MLPLVLAFPVDSSLFSFSLSLVPFGKYQAVCAGLMTLPGGARGWVCLEWRWVEVAWGAVVPAGGLQR